MTSPLQPTTSRLACVKVLVLCVASSAWDLHGTTPHASLEQAQGLGDQPRGELNTHLKLRMMMPHSSLASTRGTDAAALRNLSSGTRDSTGPEGTAK
jgi:hypothetical protein